MQACNRSTRDVEAGGSQLKTLQLHRPLLTPLPLLKEEEKRHRVGVTYRTNYLCVRRKATPLEAMEYRFCHESKGKWFAFSVGKLIFIPKAMESHGYGGGDLGVGV